MRKIVFGFAGIVGSGKTSAARYLAERHGFSVVSFAAPIKKMALAYGLTQEEIGSGKEIEFTRPIPPLRSAMARDMLAALPDSIRSGIDAASLEKWFWNHLDELRTPRRFLQLLGTEWGRQMVRPSLWTDAWRAEVGDIAASHFRDLLIVCDDVRLPDEVDTIHAEGGRVVGIKRPGAGSASGGGHITESGVDVDFWLWNDGPFEVLRARLDGLVERLQAA